MPFKNPHPLYSAWQGMRQRCRNPNFRQWTDYGGRGIKICPEWDSFAQFAADMGPKPSPDYSLDRIDNNGDYSPSNCRWSTKEEQQRNQRVTRHVIIGGQVYRAIDLADKAGLKTDTIIERVMRGLSYEQVISPNREHFSGGVRKAIEVRVRNQRNATHCKHGHPWDGKNTRITPQGHKNCRECHRIKMRRRTKEKSLARGVQ